MDDPLFTGECSVLLNLLHVDHDIYFLINFLNRTVEKSIKVHRASLNTVKGCQKPYLAKEERRRKNLLNQFMLPKVFSNK